LIVAPSIANRIDEGSEFGLSSAQRICPTAGAPASTAMMLSIDMVRRRMENIEAT
jgi:hypothetical protein